MKKLLEPVKKLAACMKDTARTVKEVVHDELSVRYPNYGKYMHKFFEIMTYITWCILLLLPGFVLVFILGWALKDEPEKS